MKPAIAVAAVGGIVGLIALGVWRSAAWREAPSVDGQSGHDKKKDAITEKAAIKILTKEEAIRIAKEYWRAAKGTEMREDRPVEVSLDIGKNEYTVLFKTPPLPPGTRGADYHAKFRIDATTGKVKDAMVGS